MSTAAFDQSAPPEAAEPPRTNYFNASYSITSWLFTTDHKRIAILYLIR